MIRQRWPRRMQSLPVRLHLTPGTMDSLYTFKCKHFCNSSHTVTFGIPL
jgi:hypothetical protein